MNTAREIVTELHARGIRVESRPHGGVRLTPASLIGPKLLDQIRQCKNEFLAYACACQTTPEIDRITRIDRSKTVPPASAPAYSIIETCQRYGVLLRIDEVGDLVVGKAGAKADEPTQPWSTLIVALEAHYDAVRDLVCSGWTLKVSLSKQAS